MSSHLSLPVPTSLGPPPVLLYSCGLPNKLKVGLKSGGSLNHCLGRKHCGRRDAQAEEGERKEGKRTLSILEPLGKPHTLHAKVREQVLPQ